MNNCELAATMEKADSHPDEVDAQIAAAWANDSYGSEEEAIRYYDAAWQLGVPVKTRQRFLVGYGSTLRNVGRLEDSIAIHSQAVSENSSYAPHHAFLALALNTAGRHDEALAAAFTATLLAGAEGLDGYERALSEYRDLLLDAAAEPSPSS